MIIPPQIPAQYQHQENLRSIEDFFNTIDDFLDSYRDLALKLSEVIDWINQESEEETPRGRIQAIERELGYLKQGRNIDADERVAELWDAVNQQEEMIKILDARLIMIEERVKTEEEFVKDLNRLHDIINPFQSDDTGDEDAEKQS